MANDASDELGKLTTAQLDELGLALARHAAYVSSWAAIGKSWPSDALEEFVFDIIDKVVSGQRPWSRQASHSLRQHLFKCVESEVRNQAKKKSNATTDDISTLDEPAGAPTAEELLMDAERERMIQDLVASVSKDNTVMQRIGGLWLQGCDSPGEIAAITGIAVSEVNGILQTLRRRMRSEIHRNPKLQDINVS